MVTNTVNFKIKLIAARLSAYWAFVSQNQRTVKRNVPSQITNLRCDYKTTNATTPIQPIHIFSYSLKKTSILTKFYIHTIFIYFQL